MSIYLFSSISTSVGSVNLIFLPRKSLCEDSILNINATTFLDLVKEVNFSQLNPCARFLMDMTSVTKDDDVFKQLSTSQEETSKKISLITRSSGING